VADYTYLVTDLATNAIREELRFGGVTYETALNARGAFSGSLSRRAAGATRDVLQEGSTGLYVVRDGSPVWGGYITRIDADSKGADLRVAGVGHLGYYDRRYLREDRTYTAVEQATIMADLIRYCNGEASLTYGPSVGPFSGIPMVVSAPATGTTRDRAYVGNERPFIGDLLRKITEVDGGPDMEVVTTMVADALGRRSFVNTFTVWARKGSLTPTVTLEFGGSCDQYAVGYNAESLITRAEAMNDADSADRLIAASNESGTLAWDGMTTRSGVTDLATLQSWADRLRATFSGSLVTPVLEGNGNRLSPLDLAVGDLCRARIADGYVQVDGTYRVVGRRVSVGGGGSERVAFGLADPTDTGVAA
jgi:hypothetical protein